MVCSRTPNQSLAIQTCKSPCFACCASFASRVRRCCAFVVIFIAIEPAWGPLQLTLHLNLHGSCNHCCDRTCSFARFIAIDVLARSSSRSTNCHHVTLVAVDELDYEHCRDRTYSFVLAIVVFVRDHHRDQRIVAIGVLACDPHRNRQMCHATLVAADLLVRDRCCDRASSFGPSWSRLDRATACHVALGRAC